MKTALLILSSIFYLLTPAIAQNNTPPMPGSDQMAATAPLPTEAATNIVTTKTPTPIQQLGTGLTAGYQALSQLSFTNGLSGGPFGIRHDSDYGGGLFVRTANPTGVNVGFALAGIYEHVKNPVTLKSRSELNFYDATLNISLNGTTVIPFLNYPLDYILESGPATNLKDPKTIYEQSLVGVEKTWRLGSPVAGQRAWAITLQVGEGHCSRWGSGFFQEAAAAITYKPHGW